MNDKTFVYGGRHFTPIRRFGKQDDDIFKITQKLRRDPELKDVNRNYTHKDFYAAATDKSCDIFQCEENGLFYVPCEYELQQYLIDSEPNSESQTMPKKRVHRKNRFDETYKQEGTDTYESVLQENILKNGSDSDLYVWIYHQYKQSFDWGNARLNLHKMFNPDQVKDITDILKANRIQTFTFSADWSGAIDIAWLFTKNGYVLKGMVTILNPTDIKSVVPAYLFVKEAL